GLHYNRYRYYEPFSARYISKDPIGLLGGLNNSAYVSDANQWVDPLGLDETLGSAMREAFVERIPGAKIPTRLKDAPELYQMTDRVLTGMNVNATAAALVGVTASAGYDGNGKYNVRGGNAYGVALEVTSTREVINAGTQTDGKYYELCASAGLGLAVQTCVGYSRGGRALWKCFSGCGIRSSCKWSKWGEKIKRCLGS
ncbi:RHS repeat-associated core domain-containing protein, partial [Acinetobacter sp. DSM 11652]|uniref:RHS repeat-associated core domain-containing protein n=1 Tax=Acinetobacter sp. DSM 11652 TaxID=346222 RepID=UPI0008C948C5